MRPHAPPRLSAPRRRRCPALLALLLLGVAACSTSFDPTLRFACATDAECTVGFVCGSDQICVAKEEAQPGGSDATADVNSSGETAEAADTTGEPGGGGDIGAGTD